MFLQETVTLDLVSFVLGFLLEPAGPGSQLVLLFPAFAAGPKRLFRHRGHPVDD